MSDSSFDPASVASFHVDPVSVVSTPTSVDVTLHYRLLAADASTVVSCIESYSFPTAALVNGSVGIPPERWRAFLALIDRLAVVAGLSYYKLAAPPRVFLEHAAFTVDEVEAFRTILAKGLGEFCFENGLDAELWPTVEYRAASAAPVTLASLDLPLGPLVPVGGGKDSCVSIEALRSAGMDPTLITVRRFPVIQNVIDMADLADYDVTRVLDSQLGSLNRSGALNGHVPVTAIVSLAVAAMAVLTGHRAVVMSNERSASEGNVSYRGVEINHQWSKSEEADVILRALIAGAAPGLEFFSLLRPLSELSIAQRFASTCMRYFDTFSSCNAAFRIDESRRVQRWCGVCPKCQFVYLALATVLPRDVITGIWGSEVFDTSSYEGFQSLLGLTDWKPFECVGESLECRVALAMLVESSDWSKHGVVLSLAGDVRAARRWPTAAERQSVFAFSALPSTPASFMSVLA